MFLKLFLVLWSVFSTACFAATLERSVSYYGKEFLSSPASNEELKKKLFTIVSGYHSQGDDGFDLISSACDQGKTCLHHTAIGYERARQFLFGDFYLVKGNQGYGIKDVYCDRVALAAEFSGTKPGPNIIPDPKVINAEHTWPQSLFTPKFDKEDQKSDVHHIFPTDSEMNSSRGSFDFGDVVSNNKSLKCSPSRMGNAKNGKTVVFEPPVNHKGNVARAIFYFSVRYQLPINPEEEQALREWHRLDPVDQEERDRNNRIFDLQKNRNPFIDYPELVDRIANF